MAQFDIHRNPGSRTRRTHPFLLNIQSPRFETVGSFIVIPLTVRSAVPLDDIERSRLTPNFRIDGQVVFLNPFEITNVEASRLCRMIASLAGDDDARRSVQIAMDAVLASF